MFRRLFLPALLCLAPLRAAGPPGVVIHHSPAASGLYIGSPSICILPDGAYLASHDLFGPASHEHQRGAGRLYRSTDRGASWHRLVDFEGFFWQGLFVHRGAAYALGTDRHHGRLVIRRSTDGGATWTTPADAASGVLAEGEWHTAPVPVIEQEGRLWRAVEDAMGGTRWGERYRARMISAPVDADLLDSRSWTFSNPLPRDPEWLAGDFGGWLEGNAVPGPQGGVLDILRVETSRLPEKAALVGIDSQGAVARFDPASGFVDLPGGAKKFSIRRDPQGGGYWSLVNAVPENLIATTAGRPATVRNTLALVHSTDLRQWEIRSLLLHHPEVSRHAFQYVDWQFDGADLVAVCRTAWDEEACGAHTYHDANFLTFHRWPNFRTLTRQDDVPVPAPSIIDHRTERLSLRGTGYEIGMLQDGERAFSDRSYVWQEVPAELAGCAYTRLAGGVPASIEITARQASLLHLATSAAGKAIALDGWQPEDRHFRYSDADRTRLTVYSRPIAAGESLKLPTGNWTGALLLLEK